MRLSRILIILTLFCGANFAQEMPLPEKRLVEWQVFSNKNEFVIAMPEGVKGFTENNDFTLGRGPGNRVTKRILTSFSANGAVLITEVFEGDVRDVRNELIKRITGTQIPYVLANQRDYGDISLSTYNKNGERLFSIQQFVLFKKRLYVVQAHAESERNIVVDGFLRSLRITSGDKAVTPNLPPGGDPQIAFRPPALIIDVVSVDDTAVYEGKPDRDVIFLYKPRPQYTSEARRARASGEVKLKVLFSASGNIIKSEVETGELALTESAKAAAEQILFIPAEKDGKRVSVWKKISYSFSTY